MIQILRAVRRQPIFAVVACGYMMGVTAARADDWADCQSKTTAQIISGCTSVIQKGGRNVREMAQAYRLRGDSYLQQNRHDQAIADYDQALKLDPNHSWALVGRGTAFSRTGKLDQAFADLNRAIALDPKRRRPTRSAVRPMVKNVIGQRQLPTIPRRSILPPVWQRRSACAARPTLRRVILIGRWRIATAS